MEIKQIQDKQEWEEFVLAQPSTIFVQSYKYGDFYESMGESSWIFGIYNSGKLIGGSLVVSTHAKRGDFLYLPYGPILSEKDRGEALEELTKFLKKFAKENKYSFIRVSPFIDDTKESKKIFKKAGYSNAPIHVLAETTWLLDIQKPDEKLLAEMKKNHRNLIRRCERDGIKIEKTSDIKNLGKFNELHDETAKRHNFHRFSDDYVKKEFSVFTPNNEVMLFNAYLPDGRLDSSSVMMFYGNMAAYRHSGSLGLDKKLPTSYLLQWEAIKEAKKRGIKYYNFWGIAPEDAHKKHPFRGITHFKKGFGGFQKDLLHCQDLPVSAKYWVTWVIETIRSFNRGFK
ncbi:MAG: peptidoglycan bridge formation glycyltransferase FemA/FemB family protein [Candidatus Magasanikbacteria bacterium]|jgi:peptidoglycan pentaglycine glycine transferase (the first glycine)|nr:peptidoglycan bridge formation glycyltransferase FemA/FemB family protein [Candidatus Magasanikbacteria bacterium]MBT4314704.1 peptidoglycan bridge formation glycyltransferase FemA/FemB family protein [Candidatus Magasanikbacteria bacterium]MBT4547481.1 peptidoglycan bridge formation glycyltransferase FemA/FemB family protein [Candidatus Magasanikbacteria bacterium]MBT6819594.1 peptidoglycan bridge formation glycyltransferase FemA/FemB family protein [Candidatus Magasanikbacteria bacterium]